MILSYILPTFSSLFCKFLVSFFVPFPIILCKTNYFTSFPHRSPFSANQQGVDMNLGDYDGRTALHLAAAEGHLRCVKFLLEECKVKHDPKDR